MLFKPPLVHACLVDSTIQELYYYKKKKKKKNTKESHLLTFFTKKHMVTYNNKNTSYHSYRSYCHNYKNAEGALQIRTTQTLQEKRELTKTNKQANKRKRSQMNHAPFYWGFWITNHTHTSPKHNEQQWRSSLRLDLWLFFQCVQGWPLTHIKLSPNEAGGNKNLVK